MDYDKRGDVYIVSVARGEEIVESLKNLAKQEGVLLASVHGIGAAENVELGYYNVEQQEYSTRVLSGEYEIVNLTGNISTMDDAPYVHVHITLGDNDFAAHAGHLVQATVSGACELIVQTISGRVDREKDTEVTGLNLFKL